MLLDELLHEAETAVIMQEGGLDAFSFQPVFAAAEGPILADDNPADPVEDDRSAAHCTGAQGAGEGEHVPVSTSAGSSDADCLGVGGRIAGLHPEVVTKGENRSIRRHEGRSDGDAALIPGLEGLGIGSAEGEAIERGLVHGDRLSPMTEPEFPGVVVFEHPLIQHKLSYLRDRETGHRPFRALLYQIAGLMVYEVTRQFPTQRVDVQTPMERTSGMRIAGRITVVSILRAGLGMAEGVLEMMPEARVGHLGLYRDEKTLQPVAYLTRLPRDLNAGPVLLVDTMLATAGSALAAVETLRKAGAADLRFMCLVAAPEGLRRLTTAHPGLPIYIAAVDRQLNEQGFILPGLGDAGDRLYGTE
jgi:uracil phosphoribosyltransferase